jgi:hypothetical protein
VLIEIHSYNKLSDSLNQDGCKILFFTWPNSLQCKAYFPIVEDVSQELNYDLYLINVEGKNIDEYLCSFDILFCPTLVVMSQTSDILRISGLNTKRELKRIIKNNA